MERWTLLTQFLFRLLGRSAITRIALLIGSPEINMADKLTDSGVGLPRLSQLRPQKAEEPLSFRLSGGSAGVWQAASFFVHRDSYLFSLGHQILRYLGDTPDESSQDRMIGIRERCERVD